MREIVIVPSNDEADRCKRDPTYGSGDDSDDFGIGGGDEAGLAAETACAETACAVDANVNTNPPACRGDEIEGPSRNSAGNTSLAVADRASSPLPSQGHVLQPPSSVDEDLEQKLHSTQRKLAAFKVALILGRHSPFDRHTPTAVQLAALSTGRSRAALALSRWRSLVGSGWSRSLGSRARGSRFSTTAITGASGEGSIEAPSLMETAIVTVAPVPTGFSRKRSSDSDGWEKRFLDDNARQRGGTAVVQPESNVGSRLAEKQRRHHPIFPPMPPMTPAPRTRTVETGSLPIAGAAAWEELEQDRSEREHAPRPPASNHWNINTPLLVGTMTGGFSSCPDHASREGDQPREGNGTPTGEVQDQDSLAGTRGPSNILSPLPFLAPLKEEEEDEDQEEEHEQENAPAESKDWRRDGVGVRVRETSIVVRNVRPVGGIVRLEETVTTTREARTPSFVGEVVDIDERMPTRGVPQELEEEERAETLMGNGAERHRPLYAADREEEDDSASPVPGDDNTACNDRLDAGGVEDDGRARGEGHGEQRQASRTRADNGEAADRVFRRDADTVPQRHNEAKGVIGRDEFQSAVAEIDAGDREESDEESDSSYRRDCAVLAGTAKIAFALNAANLDHMATAMTAPAAGAVVEENSRDGSGATATGRGLEKLNALENWTHIQSSLENKQVVLFLDYDGTLSPIVDQPDKAFMKDGMRPVLAQAASVFTTAIVTGRSKDKVYNFVGLDDVFYAGSHGLEIQGPLERPVKCQMAENMRPTLEACTEALHSLLSHVPGYEIEDNKFSLSVHYRQVVSSAHVDEVHQIVHEYVANAPEIVVKAGKKVLELRPKVDWNKGSAVNWILDALDLGHRSDVFPIYLGDDITDEDAFVAMETRACGGMGILVKEKFDPERPPETNASFSLRNPDEVQSFLSTLVSFAKDAGAEAKAPAEAATS
eukprot:g10742.t1